MLGKNIRKVRQKQKISQERLARSAGISLNTLTKIESGFTRRPSFQTIKKITDALGASIDDLARTS